MGITDERVNDYKGVLVILAVWQKTMTAGDGVGTLGRFSILADGGSDLLIQISIAARDERAAKVVPNLEKVLHLLCGFDAERAQNAILTAHKHGLIARPSGEN